jgi:hypothetical protein
MLSINVNLPPLMDAVNSIKAFFGFLGALGNRLALEAFEVDTLGSAFA